MDENDIPKVINYCWFGNNPKSLLIIKCINSWKKYFPDYKIIEWNEKNFNININKYVSDAYKNKKWAFVSDYARIWIIYNYGGFYFDTDVEVIKNFENENGFLNGFFCIENKMIATGLGFATKKGDIILKQILDFYDKTNFINKDGSLNLTTCVLANNYVFENAFGLISKINLKTQINGYTIFPNEYFCPLNYVTGELVKTQNTVAIHWYGASWLTKKQKFINKLKIIIRNIIGNKSFENIKNKIKGKE